jgi:prephenate dehydratase/chorismate mutase/prephenate dehydratase
MDLKKIRETIDILDWKILKLLNDRMELCLLARKCKTTIVDKRREEELLCAIKKKTSDLIDADFSQKVFEDIINESKKLQAKDLTLIAFQGEHGAYSEEAARLWNKDFIPMPCKEFGNIFEGVAEGMYDYGIVPVENTLGGIIGEVNEHLIKTDLVVVGALELPIHHCLLTIPGSDYREMRYVYSHYQALAQCKEFIHRNKLEPITFYDTAGAARWLFEKMTPQVAVIASKLSSELYNLEVIKENIEDHNVNKTRFLILAKEETKQEGDKCSVIFSTKHKAGALFSVLECFARENINLTRIESVPSVRGEYAFFLDFHGSIHDSKITSLLDTIRSMTKNLKFMGCYNEMKVEE